MKRRERFILTCGLALGIGVTLVPEARFYDTDNEQADPRSYNPPPPQSNWLACNGQCRPLKRTFSSSHLPAAAVKACFPSPHSLITVAKQRPVATV